MVKAVSAVAAKAGALAAAVKAAAAVASVKAAAHLSHETAESGMRASVGGMKAGTGGRVRLHTLSLWSFFLRPFTRLRRLRGWCRRWRILI